MLASTRNELKTTKENLGKQKEESDRLWEHHDDLEQYTRKNSLEIHGIPEDAYPSTEAAVIKVAEALNITIEPEEIEISHKLNRGKSIIVKFCNHKVKSKLYKERTKLKDVKIKDLFPSYPSNAQERQRIFINENLTAYRRRIMKEANKRRQEGTLLSVWSLDGKIFAINMHAPRSTLYRKKTNHLWKAEWGYQAYFTSFESNKAGVCILFNNNFNLQLQRLYTDPAGRFIICDLK
ncbi:unnamed protein product, partial [Porites lobata]